MIHRKDLAKQLNISPATLSLVLNGKPNISERTRTRVLNQLIQAGYRDQISEEALNASSLKELNAGKKLALVVFNNNGKLVNKDSFLPLILLEMEDTARKYGYQLIIITIEKDRINSQISYIKESGCEGFVLFATEMQEEDLKSFEELNIPFTLLDNFFPDHKVSSVVVNNQQGITAAVNYLLAEGHQKIGYLSSGLEINSFIERQGVAIQALQNTGRTCSVYAIGYPHENAFEGMMKLLSETPKESLPTAFLSDNDLVAFGAIQAIQAAGYRVPEDFSIIGYDNRPVCTLITPAITTLELPRNVFGTEALEMLVRKLGNKQFPFISTGICCNLVKRDSVCPPHIT